MKSDALDSSTENVEEPAAASRGTRSGPNLCGHTGLVRFAGGNAAARPSPPTTRECTTASQTALSAVPPSASRQARRTQSNFRTHNRAIQTQ